ncbi:4'-phosphopantetheinyl transferase family protein [Shewanella sp.]|uniref:4'-phosphopantetheinyl transferase family protein n=1 Tax=Shewanella sp. TaxID=50422 RepID=UPI004047E807
MPIHAAVNSLYPFTKSYIYFVSLNAQLSAADFDKGLALAWLSPDEAAKVARYKSPSARNNALQVRLALRAILSRHSAVNPAQWQFTYGEKGKPALSQEWFAKTGLYFNLSHSGQWLMIGVITGTKCNLSTDFQGLDELFVGVDIERERSSTDIVPILHHYFTQAETDALLQLPIELQRQRFFDLWAVKESYIKARGLGLALSLKSFSVDFSATVLSNATLKLPDNSSKMIPMFEPVKLSFSDANDPAATDVTWQTLMGRLNEGYRFSMTLGIPRRVCNSTDLQSGSISNTLTCVQLELGDLLNNK